MGVSTDAILFYGYAWTDEDAEYGWLFELPMSGGDSSVSIGMHCCDELALPYLAVDRSVVVVARGDSALIANPIPTWSNWPDEIALYLKEHGIEIKPGMELGWHLVSWWG